jgi:DNA invertase Pin-like site-specific DNA recombinase
MFEHETRIADDRLLIGYARVSTDGQTLDAQQCSQDINADDVFSVHTRYTQPGRAARSQDNSLQQF